MESEQFSEVQVVLTCAEMFKDKMHIHIKSFLFELLSRKIIKQNMPKSEVALNFFWLVYIELLAQILDHNSQ